MTQREFLTSIIETEGTTAEQKEYAQGAIVKLDNELAKRKEKAKETPTKKAIENAPLFEKIMNEILTTEAMTASEVAAVLECSVQKASSLLRQLANDEKISSADAKLPKKGNVKVYALIEG